LVEDVDDDVGLAAFDSHGDLRLRLSMLDGVAKEVREQLVHSIAIPHALQIAAHVHLHGTIRIRELRFADHLPADIVHVEATRIDRNPTS